MGANAKSTCEHKEIVRRVAPSEGDRLTDSFEAALPPAMHAAMTAPSNDVPQLTTPEAPEAPVPPEHPRNVRNDCLSRRSRERAGKEGKPDSIRVPAFS